jgi:hypothetical protein
MEKPGDVELPSVIPANPQLRRHALLEETGHEGCD